MSFMLVQVFIKAIVLMVILFFVAKDEADMNLLKIALTVALIGLGSVLINGFVTPIIGLLSIIPEMVLAIFLFMTLLWLSFKKSLFVLVPYMALTVLLSIGFGLLVSQIDKSVDSVGGSISEKTQALMQQDTDEALAVVQEINDATMRSLGVDPEDIEADVMELQDLEVDEPLELMELADEVEEGEEEEEEEETKPKFDFEQLKAKFSNLFKKKSADAGEVEEEVSGDLEQLAAMEKLELAPEELELSPEETAPAPVDTGPYALPDDPEWERAWRLIKINSRATGRRGKEIAFIGNKDVMVGDIVPVEYRGKIYQYELMALTKHDAKWVPVYEPQLDYQ